MSSERKNTGLRVALASYDVHQLRVWHQYIAEQSAEILCSEYRSGEELLQSLKQGRNTEVVVLGGPLEDMDSREFLERMSRLPQKPLLLLQDNARRERTAVSSLSPDGPCYLIRQSSLKELLASLLTAAGQESGTLEQRFGRMYQEWGIIQPDSNCDYLTEAVLIASQSKGKLAIRKEILQVVAEHHNVTVAAVDSGLRRLIDALETRQMPAWKAFKEKTHLAGQKVTAGKLIYTLREEMARQAKVHLTVSCEPDTCPVLGSPEEAELMVFHLLSNALRASAPGGKIFLRLCRAEDAWRLTVTDHGCGLPGPANWQENRRRFLGGAGAGLKICRAVCRRAGWGFALEAGSGGGAEAVVTLPMEPETAASGDTIALHAAGEVLPSRLRWQLERELHLLAGNA